MVTYEFYKDEYKGQSIPSSSFDMYIRKAESLVNKLLRVYVIYNTEEEIANVKDFCICDVADLLYTIDETIGGNVVSESDGSSSITYNSEMSPNMRLLSVFGTYFEYYRGS